MIKIYLLTIFICSAVSGECNVSNLEPFEYNTYYKCMQDGYGKSYEMLFADTPRETVEDGMLFTKWICKEELTQAS